jgi:hypothetical protein
MNWWDRPADGRIACPLVGQASCLSLNDGQDARPTKSFSASGISLGNCHKRAFVSTRHLWNPMRFRATVLILATVLVCLSQVALAAPIQQIQGVIVELEEGYLWLKPDGEAAPRKFLLRWKARFNPPKLPLKGDRVLILYKDKEEGSVIYGVDYLTTTPEPAQSPKDQVPDKGK